MLRLFWWKALLLILRFKQPILIAERALYSQAPLYLWNFAAKVWNNASSMLNFGSHCARSVHSESFNTHFLLYTCLFSFKIHFQQLSNNFVPKFHLHLWRRAALALRFTSLKDTGGLCCEQVDGWIGSECALLRRVFCFWLLLEMKQRVTVILWKYYFPHSTAANKRFLLRYNSISPRCKLVNLRLSRLFDLFVWLNAL